MAKYSKFDIRERTKRIRNQLPISERYQASARVCNQVSQLEHYRDAARVALYRSVRGEINLDILWQTESSSRSFYFPIIQQNKTLLFLPATPETYFSENQFKILEPSVPEAMALPPNEIDVMLIPLIAFDEQGHRIGMGEGYYDRTLSLHRPRLLLGVAYEFQKQHCIIPEPWDVTLDAVVTEKTVYWRTGS